MILARRCYRRNIALLIASAARWCVMIPFWIIVDWPFKRWDLRCQTGAPRRGRLVIVVGALRWGRRIVIDALLLGRWPIVSGRTNGCVETRWWRWFEATFSRRTLAIYVTVTIWFWGCLRRTLDSTFRLLESTGKKMVKEAGINIRNGINITVAVLLWKM